MPKFFVYWEVNPVLAPTDPKDMVKLWTMMLNWVKADIKAGIMTDWGLRAGELSGYGITSDISEEQLNQFLLKWTPYVKFEANPVLTADQQIAALQKLQQMMKGAP